MRPVQTSTSAPRSTQLDRFSVEPTLPLLKHEPLKALEPTAALNQEVPDGLTGGSCQCQDQSVRLNYQLDRIRIANQRLCEELNSLLYAQEHDLPGELRSAREKLRGLLREEGLHTEGGSLRTNGGGSLIIDRNDISMRWRSKNNLQSLTSDGLTCELSLSGGDYAEIRRFRGHPIRQAYSKSEALIALESAREKYMQKKPEPKHDGPAEIVQGIRNWIGSVRDWFLDRNAVSLAEKPITPPEPRKTATLDAKALRVTKESHELLTERIRLLADGLTLASVALAEYRATCLQRKIALPRFGAENSDH